MPVTGLESDAKTKVMYVMCNVLTYSFKENMQPK